LVSAVERTDRSLLRATSELLKRHGINAPLPPQVTAAWEVDLDGNGQSEIIWSARSREEWTSPYTDASVPGHARQGDYALAALQFGTQNPRHVALAVSGVASAAPRYRILPPVDGNGDGRAEVFVLADYFEDEELLVYGFTGGEVKALVGGQLPATGRASAGYRH
jgi:hypothetical protein